MKVNPPTILFGFTPPYVSEIVRGDARNAITLLLKYKNKFSYCVTSSPYWNMLHNSGSEVQRARRNKNLKLVYSESDEDVGNIHQYAKFLQILKEIYEGLLPLFTEHGKLTIITKNVKQEGTLYTLLGT